MPFDSIKVKAIVEQIEDSKESINPDILVELFGNRWSLVHMALEKGHINSAKKLHEELLPKCDAHLILTRTGWSIVWIDESDAVGKSKNMAAAWVSAIFQATK